MADFPEAQRAIFKRCAQQTVTVLHSDSKKDYSGSGIVFSRTGLIVTAAHVIEGADTVKIKLCRLDPDSWKIRSTGRYTADVIAVFKGADVAALRLRKVPKRLKPAAIVGAVEAKTGHPVLRIGNDDRQLASGHVIGMSRHNSYPVIRLSLETTSGASGGPLFSFTDSVLLGMIIEHDDDKKMPDVGYALTTGEILRLIRQRKAVRELLPDSLLRE